MKPRDTTFNEEVAISQLLDELSKLEEAWFNQEYKGHWFTNPSFLEIPPELLEDVFGTVVSAVQILEKYSQFHAVTDCHELCYEVEDIIGRKELVDLTEFNEVNCALKYIEQNNVDEEKLDADALEGNRLAAEHKAELIERATPYVKRLLEICSIFSEALQSIQREIESRNI